MLSHDDIREILRIIDESELDELRIETEGFSLHVRKGGAAAEVPVGDAAGAGASAPAARVSTAAAADAPAPAPPPEAPPEQRDGLVTIPSPMLGTFYRAESPGAEPFVDVGSEVEPETTVCIIEVMKMMNSVPAGVSGTIEEICPGNGTLVEYGDPLFRVRPR